MIGKHVHEAATTSASPASEASAYSRGALGVLRDITRGGLAGLIVGVVLAGVGGRAVMRLAALLVPSATGAFTENGNRIGDITLGGSLGIIIAVGLLFGAVAGSLWVIIRPWLPDHAWWRALATIPIAVALGTRGLIEARNRDFAILDHDPLVVASLVALVAGFGPALVLVDAWLDRRLPHPEPGESRVVNGFLAVTILGTGLTVLLVVPFYLAAPMTLVGVALTVVGLATLATWAFRGQERGATPRWIGLVARGALVATVVAGLAVVVPEVQGALGTR